MALPFLPGNSFDQNIGRTYFAKPHHFDLNNDVNLLIDKSRPNHSVLPRGDGTALPTWVAYDKQVLAFDGFFEEASKDRRGDVSIHPCRVLFFLEDDSIQVVQPKSKPGGSAQATIIRRHRVSLPPPNESRFYTVEDLNLGNELPMYGRLIKLCDCDEFTRNFLRKIGVRINPGVVIPRDSYTESRKAVEGIKSGLRPYERRDTLRHFLDHDRHVLRFYCFWDDRENMFGDPHQMVLHYYLADDTCEVREIIPANSGRDAVPMFLHRCKLPKVLEPLRKPGEIADRTVLNVFGPMGKGGRYILDNRKTGEVHQDFYTDKDFRIGAEVNVWGRTFLIYDCDEFTKEFYRTKYGLSDFTPIKIKCENEMEIKTTEKSSPDVSSSEDIGVRYVRLDPMTIPPKRSFAQFMEKRRYDAGSEVLRFLAKLDSKKSYDLDRRFIISCFLVDNTFIVYEPPVRNSGIVGGKFLERSKIRKPNQTEVDAKKVKYYSSLDLFIGAGINFNNHQFILIDADDYAYNYMEQHAREYRQSDVELVMERLSELAQDARLESLLTSMESLVYLPTLEFCDLIRDLSRDQLTDQEILTLVRYYQDREDESVSVQALLYMLQDQMKRGDFEDFHFITEGCVHFDRDRTGTLKPERVRTVFRSLKIPVQDDMLRALVGGLADANSGRVNYVRLAELLNWRKNPVVISNEQLAVWNDDAWFGNKSVALVRQVNTLALLQDLLGIKRS